MKNWSNLSKVIYKRTYSRNDNGVSEDWNSTIQRVIGGNTKGFDVSEHEKQRLFYFLQNRKAMPAGRGLWYSGTASHEKLGGAALNNCWGSTAEEWYNFVMAQDLLMLGGGVGMSVEHKFTSKLPKIKKDVNITNKETKDADFIVPDSREGWLKLTENILESFFVTGKSFSYSTVCIRGAGEPISGFGGKASGPLPIHVFVKKLCAVLRERSGKHVRPIDAADILCSVGELVVSGNVRRSAILILGDPWDKEYLKAKRWDLGPIPSQRAMANFSVNCSDIDDLHPLYWQTYEHGEAFGIANIKNANKFARIGELKEDFSVIVNPCAESNLQNGEACNLQELFLPNLSNKQEFIEAARLMHRWGKRVSCEKYHNPKNDNVIKKNRRVGTGITGCLQSNLFEKTVLDEVYNEIQKENESYSSELKIPQSIRTTVIKPSGCQVKSTLISTSKGLLTLEEIGDVQGDIWQQIDDISAFTDKGNNLISKFFVNGKTETRKIITKDGNELECSLNHRYRILDENNNYIWKYSSELKIGDRMVCKFNTQPEKSEIEFISLDSVNYKYCSNSIEIKQPKYLDKDISWFLGLFYGDGSVHEKGIRISFNRKQPELLRWIVCFFKEKFGLEPKIDDDHSLYVNSVPFRKWLEINGCLKSFSIEISVPKIIRMSSRDNVLSFINGFWRADGGQHNPVNWSLCSVSKKFSQQMLALCRSVGFNVKIKNAGPSSSSGGLGSNDRYIVLFRDASPKKLRYLNRSFKDRIWGEFWLDPITEIIKSENYTYDIEVENEHCYIANGVISHNTLSLLGDCTPGIHPAFSRYYIRRVRFAANDDLIPILKKCGHYMEPVKKLDGSLDLNTLVVDFYCNAPENTPCADEGFDTWKQLDILKMSQRHWADQSVSVTVYYKREEIQKIKNWIAENLNEIKTISFLCYNDHGFKQAPLESISREQYSRLKESNKDIDEDEVLQGKELDSLECEGGACPIK